jgi:hypothetical protein
LPELVLKRKDITMKRLVFLLLFFLGCHPAPLMKYEPTTNVMVFKDLESIPGEYFEIGALEYEGKVTTREILIQKITEMAKAHGAHGLINVSIVTSTETWKTGRAKKPGYDPGPLEGESSNFYSRVEATMIRFK